MKIRQIHNSPGVYTRFTNVKIKSNVQRPLNTFSSESGVLINSSSGLIPKKWYIGMKLPAILA